MKAFPSDRRFWFACAVLLINAGGWWWVKSEAVARRACRAADGALAAESGAPAGAAEGPARAELKPLSLTRLEQASLSPERVLTLAVAFDAQVEWDSFQERFELRSDGVPVPWHFEGRTLRDACRVRTDRPVSGDRIAVTLAPGVRSRSREVCATGQAVERLLPLVPEFRFVKIESETPSFGEPVLTARFTQAVDLRDAGARIACEPPVAFHAAQEEWGNGVQLSGAFVPGQRYTLLFRQGLRSADGYPLEQEVRRSVVVQHRRPAVSIAVDGRYLAPEGRLAVPVLAVNTREVVSSVSRVLPQNLVQLAMREAGLYDAWWGGEARAVVQALTARPTVQTNRLADACDQEQRLMLRLGELLPEPVRGVYLLEVGARDQAPRSRLLCVSDIGLSARVEADAVTVWTTGLRAGRPAAGLRAELYGRNNLLLAQGVSDAQGLVRLGFDPAEGTPFLLVAKRADGQDCTFLPLTEATEAGQPAEATRGYPDAAVCEAFVMTDREIYRPGETVFVQTLLRTRDGRPPAPFPVSLDVLKPDGRRFTGCALLPDALGASATQVALPDYVPSGTYRVQLKMPGGGALLGACAVRVESFVPPQIRVSLPELPAAARAGDRLAIKVRAEHLFGKPAAGLAAAADVTCSAAEFKPDGWAGYRFGDAEKSLPFTQVRCGRQTLGEDGCAVFEAPLDAALRPPALVQAVVQGTVTETGGRTVSARAAVPLHAYPFYLGLKPEAGSVLRVGAPQAVRVAAVNPDGSRRTARVPLKVTLEQVSWISNLRKDRAGLYQWSSERVKTPVAEGEAATGAEDALYRFTPQQAGAFVLTFTDPESQASSSWPFAAGAEGQAEGAWDRSCPERVELVFDKPEYAPGETARMQIRAPFGGHAWVSLMQERTLENRVLELTNNTAELVWSVSKAHAPNAEVTVSVVRPAVAESVWSAHRATGIAPLRVAPPSRRLKVRVAPEAAVWRPACVLPVRVAVTDAEGRPAKGAKATVLAVDEGVCQLTDYRTPDPYAYFLETRAGGLAFHDVYRQLMPITDERMLGAASHVGGDGGDELLKRLNPVAARRFKPLALWRADVALDGEGKATVPFELPEFAGELRLMAVAWNGQATGAADAPVKIRRRLVVQPDLPRVLAPGDAAQLQVALHNESGAACGARVSVAVEGPLTCDAAARTVELAAGASATAPLPVAALGRAGTGRVTVTVDGAGEHYAETIEVAVRPASAWRVTSEHLALKSGEERSFGPPPRVLSGSFSQTFSCSGRPEVNLLAALEYVSEYPYGCLEQTVSSVFPLLALGGVAERLPAWRDTLGEEAPARVNAALLRLFSMQRASGFAMWPEVWEPDRRATVYAAHFLVEASKAGYPVSPRMLDEVVQMLESRLDDGTELCAYSCHVLALAGRPDAGWTLRLFEQAGELSVESRLHLVRALIRSGEIPKAREVLEGVKNVNGLREAAFGLLAGLELDPQAPFVAVCCREIERARRVREGHWGTTQDNALALLALGTYARAAADEPQVFTPVVTWAGGTCGAAATNAFVWTGAAEAGAVTLANRGPGLMYVTRRVKAVPEAADEPQADNGLRVRRAWLDLKGEPVAAGTLRRGDLVVVRLTVEPPEGGLDNVVVEDLLPACLEIETPDLSKAGTLAWVRPDSAAWVLHREARDDRLLLFSRRFSEPVCFYYAARVVTPGEFAVPAVTASAMAAPELLSRSGAGRVTVE